MKKSIYLITAIILLGSCLSKPVKPHIKEGERIAENDSYSQSNNFYLSSLMGATYEVLKNESGEDFIRLYRKEQLILFYRTENANPPKEKTPRIEMRHWEVYTYQISQGEPVIGQNMLAYIVVSQLTDFFNMEIAPIEIKQEFSGPCEILQCFSPVKSQPQLFSNNEESHIVRTVTWNPLGFLVGVTLSILKPCDEECIHLLKKYQEQMKSEEAFVPSDFVKVIKYAYNLTNKSLFLYDESITKIQK